MAISAPVRAWSASAGAATAAPGGAPSDTSVGPTRQQRQPRLFGLSGTPNPARYLLGPQESPVNSKNGIRVSGPGTVDPVPGLQQPRRSGRSDAGPRRLSAPAVMIVGPSAI